MLRWKFVSSAAVLALALAAAIAGLSGPSSVQAASGREFNEWRQPSMQLRGLTAHEWAAIAGAAPSVQLHHPGVLGRGRTRFQPDTQTVFRLLRERQDAIITALTRRMRDASEPGAASHTADRPLLVTQPLRGPPARG